MEWIKKVPPRSLVYITIGLIFFLVAAWAFSMVLPDGVDWVLTYRPATLALLRGESPYTSSSMSSKAPFVAAPWGLIPLIPLAILPVKMGRAILLLVSILALAYTCRKLGARPLAMGLFLISPPVIHSLLNSNIEWIPLLGFVLPPQIGLFFISVKPQSGFIVGIFWLVETWRKSGLKGVVRVFGPVTAALILSFIIYGLWPLNANNALNIVNSGFNASLWPISLPVGLGLLVAAIRKRDIRFAMPASPCFSPYVIFHSWSTAVLALSANTAELAAVVAGLWAVTIIRLLGI